MQALDCGLLNLVSGGSTAQRQKSGDSRASFVEIPILANTAAKFAVEQELLKGPILASIWQIELNTHTVGVILLPVSSEPWAIKQFLFHFPAGDFRMSRTPQATHIFQPPFFSRATAATTGRILPHT